MRKVVKVVALVLALLAVVAVGFFAWARHEVLKSGERLQADFERELARIRPAFLEDQVFAGSFPIFFDHGRAKDAGPFLNPRIGWDGNSATIDRWLASLSERPRPLALDKALTDRIPEEWWKADRSLWAGVDFSWMAALRAYDHWDVERNSPWRCVGTGHWPNGFPRLFDLAPWVKLRLAKGLAEGRIIEALGDVEHVARLLFSTETLIGASLGIQCLGFADQALVAFEGTGRHPPVFANRMDKDARARMFRAVMAAQDFMRVETPPALRGDLPKIVAGRCAAMNEAMHAALAMGSLNRAPDRDGLEWLQMAMEREQACRMTWVRAEWRNPDNFDPSHLEHSCEDVDRPLRWPCRALVALPGVRALERKIAAELLPQILLANYLRHPGYK